MLVERSSPRSIVHEYFSRELKKDLFPVRDLIEILRISCFSLLLELPYRLNSYDLRQLGEKITVNRENPKEVAFYLLFEERFIEAEEKISHCIDEPSPNKDELTFGTLCALNLFFQQRYDEALNLLFKEQALRKEDPFILSMLGMTYLLLGNEEMPLRYFKKTHLKSPKEALAWRGAGIEHLLDYQYELAFNAFKLLLDNNPNDMAALYGLAASCSGVRTKDSLSQGLEAAQHLLNLFPKSHFGLILNGDLLLETGKICEVRRVDARGKNSRGSGMKYYARALSYYEQAINSFPNVKFIEIGTTPPKNHPQIIQYDVRRFVECLGKAGRYEKISEITARFLTYHDVTPLLTAASALNNSRKPLSAKLAIREAHRLDPAHSVATFEFAKILIEERCYEQAFKLLINMNQPMTHLWQETQKVLLAQIFFAVNQDKEACEEILRSNPDRIEGLKMCEQLLRKESRNQEADQHFRNMIHLNGINIKDTYYSKRLQKIFHFLGKVDEMLAKKPKKKNSINSKAPEKEDPLFQFERANSNRKMAPLKKLPTERNGGFAPEEPSFAWSVYGYYQLLKGNFSIAIDSLQNALNVNSEDFYSLTWMGMAYMRQATTLCKSGDFLAGKKNIVIQVAAFRILAIHFLNRAVENNPALFESNHHVLYDYIELLHTNKCYEKITDCFTNKFRVISDNGNIEIFNPNRFSFLCQHARALYCLGQIQETNKIFEEIECYHAPKLNADPYLLSLYGESLYEAGRYQEAIGKLQQTLKLIFSSLSDPATKASYTSTQNLYLRCLIDLKEYKKALEEANILLQVNPGEETYLLYAEAFCKTDNYADALKVYKCVLKHYPTSQIAKESILKYEEQVAKHVERERANQLLAEEELANILSKNTRLTAFIES